MAVTLTQLRAFLALLRRGSVTGAAEELVVTQPSVSAAVAALGRELGVELTERSGRGVRPSPAGAAFAPYAADVIGLLEQGTRAAREAAGASAQAVRIAAVTTAGEHVVPPIMRAFAIRNPEVRLSLEVGNRAHVFGRVLEHDADVAIGGRPPPDGRLTGRPFLRNEIVLVTAPDDPLARRRTVARSEIGARRWLLREPGSGTRVMCDDFLAQHDLSPETLTLGSNGAIKQAARAGLGVSLQSRHAVALELEAGLLATIAFADLPARDWYVLQPAERPSRPAVDAFVTFVGTPRARGAVQQAEELPPGIGRPMA